MGRVWVGGWVEWGALAPLGAGGGEGGERGQRVWLQRLRRASAGRGWGWGGTPPCPPPGVLADWRAGGAVAGEAAAYPVAPPLGCMAPCNLCHWRAPRVGVSGRARAVLVSQEGGTKGAGRVDGRAP